MCSFVLSVSRGIVPILCKVNSDQNLRGLMGNSKKTGNCALCGIETELTYEHIPPRKAFNWLGAKSITGYEIMKLLSNDRLPWDTDGLTCNRQVAGQ